jgi:hypothetical protein
MEEGLSSVAPHRGGGRRGGRGLAAGKVRDRRRRWPVGRLPREQRSGATCGGHACGRGPTGEGRELGWPESNNVDFDLNRISKLNTI